MLVGWQRIASVSLVLLLVPVTFLAGCQKPELSSGVKTISVEGGNFSDVMPDSLKEMLTSESFLLVNVHIPYQGELHGTDLFLPYDEIEQNLGKLPDKKARVVLYCLSGYMSAIAAKSLVKLGYTDVWNLHGGMQLWQEYGYPLAQKN